MSLVNYSTSKNQKLPVPDLAIKVSYLTLVVDSASICLNVSGYKLNYVKHYLHQAVP